MLSGIASGSFKVLRAERVMSTSRLFSSGGMTLFLALASLGFAGRADAADYLRGAYAGDQPTNGAGPDWAGVYGGVHAGIASGQADPRAMASPLANAAIPNTVITNTVASMITFKETNRLGRTFGGFVGMNWLWDDVVLGVEADYTHSNINTSSSATNSVTYRPAGSTDEYDITVNSASRARIRDWGTLRGRVGYAAGMFMPYLTAGVAFGNLDSRATVNGTWARFDVSSPPIRTPGPTGVINGSVARRGVTYGGALGAGVDMQIIPGTFLRAEWQYIQFASGGQRPNVSVNTARVGGGVKF